MLALKKPVVDGQKPAAAPYNSAKSFPRRNSRHIQHTTDSYLSMRLVNANPNPPVSGNLQLPGKVNYFVGKDPQKWRANIATYARVQYHNVSSGC